jgi:ElaB/YqjD/DUF883 family membrane-anchored ribosome-binding protein
MTTSTTSTKPNESDKMRQAGSHASQAASQAGQAVQDAGQAIGQKAQDLMHQAGQKAQDIAHSAGQKVQDAAHATGQKAEDATAAVGSGLKTAADRVREYTPHEGMLGRASEAVAGTLEQGGQYLQEKNLSGMADDITTVIKRNPIPAVLIGIGLGFLLGRTLRS